MLYRTAADAVVVAHIAFVLFVVLGGVLVDRYRRLAWVHVPAVAWGVAIEWLGGICPLTPLENHLRQRGGATGYHGDFIDKYLLPLLYPANVTAEVQMWLGGAALGINLLVYWRIARRALKRTRRGPSSP